MATIDNLDIQIAGSVKKANNAVNSLVKNLDKLANSLQIDTSGLEKIGQAVDLSEISNGIKDVQKQMSGFEKSAKSSMNKVSKSIDEVVKDAQNIGKGFRIEGNLSTVEKALQKYTNELQKAKLKEKELSAKGETDTTKYRDAVVDIQKYSNIIESLKKQLQSVKNTDILPENKISGANDFKKSIDDYKKELEDFKNGIKSIGDAYGGLENISKGRLDTPIENLKTTIEELKSTYPKATNVISAFEKELQRVQAVSSGLTKENISVNVDMGGLKKAENTIREKISSIQNLFRNSGMDFVFEGNSEQLEKEIQKVKNELDNLFNKQDRMIELGKVDTDSFKGVIRDIENAANRLKILEDARPDALNRTLEETQKKAKESEAALSEMNAKLKNLVVPPIREDNLNKLQSMLKKAEEELDRLRAKLKNGLTMGTINQSADDKGFQNLSAQIAVAEKRAGMLRQKIQDIGGSPKSTAGLEALSSSFHKLGTAAGKATTTIKSALKGISSVVSGAFYKIGQIGRRTASTIKNVASKIASSFAKIGSSSKSLKTAHSNLGNLLKTALGFVTIRGVFNFAKEAVNLGSSITEVENVVNTAFGSMAGHAYAFAATAKEQFGLSELAAKQYSGTMMAMLKSSGVMQAQAAKMSTTLAGLAGDIASFYNIDTDTAFYKLRSAISGETKPMKQLGVNMNIVNLEAFAMSRGITKAYKDMTLAEQATLRYNYILAKTTDAQGDFARTSGNYANQLRLLKTNFESLSAIIGQGLIAAILPAIKWLNALMSKLMEAAKVFRSFMYTLFGKVEGSQGGIVDDLGGITDGMEDIGDAAEEAGKKINKNLLLPIDELNVLSDTTDKLEDDLGIGDFDIGDFELDEFEDIDTTPINKWAQAIRDAFLAQDWEGLGKTLAELVNAGLQKVYDAIIDITQKVEQALKDFAKVFNSFVEWLEWDLLGRTIGAGINLLTTSFNALFGDDGINLEMLGNKLSQGFRGMVDEIDWEDLGNALGNGFMVGWRILDGFVTDMSRKNDAGLTGWAELGIGLGEAVNGLADRINFDQIIHALTEGFKGILETLEYLIATINWKKLIDKFNDGIESLYKGISWDNLGERITGFANQITEKINMLVDGINWKKIGRTFGAGINTIVNTLNQIIEGIDFEDIGRAISDMLNEAIEEIDWYAVGNFIGNKLMIIPDVVYGVVSNFDFASAGIALGEAFNGMIEKIDLETILSTVGKLLTGIGDFLLNFAETADWTEFGLKIANGINAFFRDFDGEKFAEGTIAFLSGLLDSMIIAIQNIDWSEVWVDIIELLVVLIADGAQLIDKLIEAAYYLIKGIFVGLIKAIEKINWDMVWQKILDLFKLFFGIHSPSTVMEEQGGFIMQGLINGIKAFIDSVIKTFLEIKDKIIEVFDGIKLYLAEVWENIKTTAKNIWNEIGNFVKGIWDGVSQIFHNTWDEISGFLSDVWSGIKNTAEEIWNSIKAFFEGLWRGVKENTTNTWDEIKDTLKSIWEKTKEIAKNVWSGIKEFFKSTWDGFKEKSESIWSNIKNSLFKAWNDIKQTAENVWGGIKGFFGGIWDGIGEGISEAFEKAINGIKNVWNTFSDWLNEKLKFEIPPIEIMGSTLFGGASIDLGKLPKFKTGGFPEDGLFMANHTELVGEFSNGKTAVTNNAQIIAGIEEAAYRGFLRAQEETSPYLADIAENTRRTAEKDMSVRIGDRDIHEANKRAEARLGWAF